MSYWFNASVEFKNNCEYPEGIVKKEISKLNIKGMGTRVEGDIVYIVQQDPDYLQCFELIKNLKSNHLVCMIHISSLHCETLSTHK